MTGLLADAAQHTTALGGDKTYGVCSFGQDDDIRLILPRLSEHGRLKLVVPADHPVQAGLLGASADQRVEVFRTPFDDFLSVVREPVAGVLINLKPPSAYGELDGDCASEHFQAASEWLQQATAVQLAAAFTSYSSLRDRFLAERLAEAILQRQRETGRYTSPRAVADLFDSFRSELEADHPNLEAKQLLRAIRVVVNREVEQLEHALEAAFHRLESFGRCTLITFNPWELAALLRFLHAHEEPMAEAVTSIDPARLVQLYPLLASGKDYAARRISRAAELECHDANQGERTRTAMLHVLEKVPRPNGKVSWHAGMGITIAQAADKPPAPDFAGGGQILKAPGEGDSQLPPHMGTTCFLDACKWVCCFGGMSTALTQSMRGLFWSKRCQSTGLRRPRKHDEICYVAKQEGLLDTMHREELECLKSNIAARKLQLKSMGLGAGQQKKDPQLVTWVKRLSALHRGGAEYVAKVQRRCRNRSHVPVLLAEAVDHAMSLGPDELYIDCTFGRGGHSRLMLSRLSQKGRLKAFDVDPMAAQIGQLLATQDVRFEMLHRPFADLAAVVLADLGGVLLDLGVSSPQLDDSSRGFSIKGKKEGPLDLRMNQEVGVPASEWLLKVTAAQLAWVISATCYRLEDPLPERIAEAILHRQRTNGPYTSTAQLAKVLQSFSAELGDEGPKTCVAHIVFCAIRVFLNREMEQLDAGLEAAFARLKPGGRCVVICFTRWEAAAVRRFLRGHEEPRTRALDGLPRARLEELYPLLASGKDFFVRQAVWPVRPTVEELLRNPRAKSLMFVLEKVLR